MVTSPPPSVADTTPFHLHLHLHIAHRSNAKRLNNGASWLLTLPQSAVLCQSWMRASHQVWVGCTVQPPMATAEPLLNAPVLSQAPW